MSTYLLHFLHDVVDPPTSSKALKIASSTSLINSIAPSFYLIKYNKMIEFNCLDHTLIFFPSNLGKYFLSPWKNCESSPLLISSLCSCALESLRIE